MKNKRNVYIIDALIVLLNIAAGRGNYLLYWLIPGANIIIIPIIVILVDLFYLTLRFKSQIFLPNWIQLKAALFFVILLIYNFLNVLISSGVFQIYTLELAILSILFVIILHQQSRYIREMSFDLRGRVKYISRGYMWIAFISIYGAILSFFLYALGLVQRVPISVDYMVSNEEARTLYYRVFMSVNYVWEDVFGALEIRVPFFQEYGMFVGLFHEPHILALNTFPCIILILGLLTKRIARLFMIISAILVILLTGSTTNVLAVIVCLATFFIIQGRKHFYMSLLGVGVVLSLVTLYIAIDDTFFMFVMDRIDDKGGSGAYSQNLLKFAFTPKSLLGTDFLSTEFGNYGELKGKDIGYIPFVFFLFFLIAYIKNTIKLLLKNDGLSLGVGLASLYYIMHSAKGGMTTFMQTLPLLIIYIQYYILSYYGRNRAIKGNIVQGE